MMVRSERALPEQIEIEAEFCRLGHTDEASVTSVADCGVFILVRDRSPS